MKIVVLGGSNTVSRTGWLEQLKASRPDLVFESRAIGSAPSMMGFCQLVRNDTLESGDIVLWEYAINDANSIRKEICTAEHALRYVEVTLRHAIQRGCSVIPIVMHSMSLRNIGNSGEYYGPLSELFALYGARAIHVNDTWKASSGQTTIPEDFYRNHAHYRSDAPVLAALGAEVSRQIDDPPSLQAPAKPLFGLETGDVRLVSAISGGESSDFANSIMSAKVHRPSRGQPLAVDLGLPEGEAWQIVAALVLRNTTEQFCFVTDGTQLARVKLFHRNTEFRKPMLSWMALATEEPMIVTAATEVRIRGRGRTEGQQDQGVVALHLERVAATQAG